MDDRLLRTARSLGGVFCSGDAHRVGLDDQEVDRLVGRGEVVRVRRGTFVVAEALRRASPEVAFSLRVRAVLRARGENVAASHQSALALHRLPLHRVDLARIDLVADVPRCRTKAGVTTHPDREVRVETVDGWRAVCASSALVQVAAASGLASGVVAMDAALHRGVCSRSELAAAAASLPLRGAGAALRAVARVDPSSESVGETLTRLLLGDLGLAPRSQVEIRDALGVLVGRADFVVGEWVVVEFDGAVKYAGADGREALVAEKRRESRLVELGFEVVRLTWADLDDPTEVLRRIRAARARVLLRHSS
ncbi:type IV toxin-antitoxin system AbiEi family antitoxin domain-containing protein [Oryzobacter sp. R7]|uniref:type IV toxin-antitoxin system AbiEi family antitoxin domain-containing protein n=1 Tax=Oryzobacter faecalis TaxID=3388656 RepID=UPI00398CA964